MGAAERKAFYEKYYATAQKTADPFFALAQWSWETGFGTNNTVKYNNLGGIKYVNQDTKYGLTGVYKEKDGYAGYRTLDVYAKDYNRVMGYPMYSSIQKALEKKDYLGAVNALNASPYSEADYSVNDMMSRINEVKTLFKDGAINDTVSVGGGGDESMITSALNLLDQFKETTKTDKGKVTVAMILFGAIAYLLISD